ncbi:hypothetical protein GCM10022220_37550 [Actinocatenispora rupis]|uniref:Uncharacterized protein n=1 Tax=Actinocatenispora rupis TaxID=519421 RepID=A0A8J3J552_9ACTN|nr:hypothetical protein Aru02nite_30410 [Actinocatenispora rupis]
MALAATRTHAPVRRGGDPSPDAQLRDDGPDQRCTPLLPHPGQDRPPRAEADAGDRYAVRYRQSRPDAAPATVEDR